jgi:hypothetical protein
MWEKLFEDCEDLKGKIDDELLDVIKDSYHKTVELLKQFDNKPQGLILFTACNFFQCVYDNMKHDREHKDFMHKFLIKLINNKD